MQDYTREFIKQQVIEVINDNSPEVAAELILLYFDRGPSEEEYPENN